MLVIEPLCATFVYQRNYPKKHPQQDSKALNLVPLGVVSKLAVTPTMSAIILRDCRAVSAFHLLALHG
eukprot:2646046-Amphidinium_carterae.1